jgi:hypothetical protein
VGANGDPAAPRCSGVSVPKEAAMDPVRRILLALPLLAATDVLGATPADAQGRDAGAAPLLRAVARMGCGTPNARTYNLTARGARAPGSGTYAPPPQQMVVRQAELVGTLELTWGEVAPRGAAADRPVGGTWSVTPMGYCTGGRGPIQFAVIVPASEGHPARFELRGPASRILRPGAVNAADEGGEVRFMGVCGRRQEVIMEIWPQQLESGATVVEPEVYRWIGNVTCTAPQAPAPSDSTARATP